MTVVVPFPTADSTDPLRFWISPSDNPPHEIDLNEFALGRTKEQIAKRNWKDWAGDFQGRPGLALEIADLIRERQPSKKEIRSILTALRGLFRFLDLVDRDLAIESSRQFKDAHGAELQRWIAERSAGVDYRRIKSLADAIRQRAGHPGLFWPARPRDRIVHTEDIDQAGMKRLFLALKKEAMSIKAMFREGAALADIGEDPRGLVGLPGSAGWHRRENHAWLTRELTRDKLLYKGEFMRRGCGGLNKANDVVTQKHEGPSYLVPGMTSRGSEGIVGKLRWFHPSYHDTAILLWLFLLGTGWNLSTALAVDITGDWNEPHPQKADYRIVHAFKRRSGRHQFTVSMEKPEWHPFRILSFMQERTASLRRTVEHRLRETVDVGGTHPTSRQIAEIEHLRAMTKSPWLYHVVNKIGEVGCMSDADSGQLNTIVRLVVEKHRLESEHPSLLAMSTGEARDAWIGHAYSSSGNNVLIARLAAQHADNRTLKHYLRRRRYRAQSEKTIRDVQDAVFGEIALKGVLDPTRLRILVQEGAVTPEQEKRLLDLRKRTRLGMGCLDPQHPPRHVAPSHPEGSLCRVQRCSGCQHGVVFAESLHPLARARAELIFLKRTLPLSTWTGSSFEDEERSMEATLASFDQGEVTTHVASWLAKLISGEVLPHDTHPIH